MVGPEKYLFDLAIYRLSEERFIEQYEYDLESYFTRTWPGQGRSAIPQEIQQNIENHFWERYGMPWRFNQVVGWLRIYTLGSQIRGELWLSKAKRFVRRRSPPPVRWIGKAFELHTFREESSEEILNNLRSEINRAIKDLGRKQLVIDLECFENVAPNMDWKMMLQGEKPDA